jgi:ADP-heptose:LPS heptosyltransferase
MPAKNNKFFVTMWGGLGDFLKIYYTHHSWRCLKEFKKQLPRSHVKALVYSLNPWAKDFIRHHPYIDEIVEPKLPLLEMRKKGLATFAGNYRPLGHAGKWVKKLKKSKPQIYLSENDKKFVNQIKNQANKYIAIHPFSAMPASAAHGRTTMAADKYMPIIEGLGKRGYSVVVLGKTRPNMAEVFDFEADNMINLVNETNVRTALALVNDADGFIGTNSCFMCLAWLEKKKSFIITSYLWETQIKKNGFTSRRHLEPQNKVMFLPRDRSTAPYDRIQRKAINWFR